MRIRNIFQWKKKRPPVVLFLAVVLAVLSCFGLFSCVAPEQPDDDADAATVTPTDDPTEEQSPPTNPTPDVPEPTHGESEQPIPQGECYTLNVNGRQLTVELVAEKLPDRDFYRVDALNIYDGGRLLNTVDTSALIYEGDYLFEGVFYLRGEGRFWDPLVDDFNFDGCDDLCLMASDHGPKNVPFAYFLWNEDGQRLDFSFVLANPLTVDEENQCLIERVFGIDEQQNIYRFDEQGRLVMQPAFMVENHVSAEYRVQEETSPLTEGQKELLTHIPAEKLPKEAVAWGGTIARKNVWEDTLVSLAYNAEYDMTLYGVVGAEELWGRTQIMPKELRSDGVVLRVGDRAQYYPFGWGGNHWYGGAPTLELVDTDRDGRCDSVAMIPWAGRGVGVHVEVLYLIDLADLTYQTVDFSQMEIQVWCDPAAKTATLTCGESVVTVDTSEKEEVTRCTAIGQVMYDVRGGQILCSMGLDFGGGVCYWAWANGVIRFWDAGPCFSDIVLSDMPLVQNG